MADNKTVFILGGLGLLYFFYSRSASATPSLYPSTPSAPGSTPSKPSTGFSTGSGSGGTGGGAAGGGTIPTPPATPTTPPVYNQPVSCLDQYGNTYQIPMGPCPASYSGFGPQGYIDTNDPCDPNSQAYDPSQCGTPTPTTPQYDSGDPCDPTSVAYDPSACTSVDYSSTTGYGMSRYGWPIDNWWSHR
jgi:hypothetical protein